MKKKYLLMGIAGVCVFSAMIGGTFAALNVGTSEGVTADISVKSIAVAVEGAAGKETVSGDVELTSAVLPGGNSECSYNVSNAAADGYDIYVKVEINKQWLDDAAELEADGCDNIYYKKGNENIVYPQGLNGSYLSENGWLVQYADEEQLVLYYTRPLKASKNANESTSTNFMDGISFDAAMGNEYAKKQLKLAYKVTAVQGNNSSAAMAAEWGMFPVFDENGVMTGIYETAAEAERYGY